MAATRKLNLRTSSSASKSKASASAAPRRERALTEQDIPLLEPARNVGFGRGLVMDITYRGQRGWFFRYKPLLSNGKRDDRRVALGYWPETTLLQARALAAACAADWAQGIDPREKANAAKSKKVLKVTATLWRSTLIGSPTRSPRETTPLAGLLGTQKN